MRLEYEGLHKAEAIQTVGARFYNDPAGYAMERYAYYVCYKCEKAYYGGEVRCEEQAAQVDEYDPAELVCGACSDVSRAQVSTSLFDPSFDHHHCSSGPLIVTGLLACKLCPGKFLLHLLI